eukprot:814320_1
MYWLSNMIECEQLIMNTCIGILSPPIDSFEFKWFGTNLMGSLLWFQNSPTNGKYLYHNLMDITKYFDTDVTKEFDNILKETQKSNGWELLHAIKNQERVLRQDNQSVGLLSQVQGMDDSAKQWCLTDDDIK